MPGHDLIVTQGGSVTFDHEGDALDDAVAAFSASARSAATRKAYRADARDFVAWCAGQSVQPLPAEMVERFALLRGTPAGPRYLAKLDHLDDAFARTDRRSEAQRFSDRADAEVVRDVLVDRLDLALAIVPVQDVVL